MDTGAQFITHYEYTTIRGDGRPVTVRMDAADVVHIRQGIDPENTRLGLSDLAALYREIGILNEAIVYTSSILRNFGVPGLMVVPDKDVMISPDGAEQIKSKLRNATTGANRGEAVILPDAVKIETLGFSPEQLALDKFLDVPESRIAAAIGIPALALGLSSGQDQKTYANMREAREQAIEEWLLPTARDIADDLDFSLREDFGLAEDQRFVFDYRHLRELQVDIDARRKSLILATGRPYLTVNEARAQEGLGPIEGGDELATPKAPAVPAAGQGTEGDEDTPAQDDPQDETP
jgi:HK97 family phage portal protein